MRDHRDYPPLTPMWTGLKGRCPRCGQGHLFKSYLSLAPRCEVCDLDYSFADPADGPAFFALTIVSFPILGLIWWFDATYTPPIWVHLVVSLPFLALAGILPLRPLKGWLVCSQYFHKAEQGRLAPRDEPDA